jgi:hypothetical protein
VREKDSAAHLASFMQCAFSSVHSALNDQTQTFPQSRGKNAAHRQWVLISFGDAPNRAEVLFFVAVAISWQIERGIAHKARAAGKYY